MIYVTGQLEITNNSETSLKLWKLLVGDTVLVQAERLTHSHMLSPSVMDTDTLRKWQVAMSCPFSVSTHTDPDTHILLMVAVATWKTNETSTSSSYHFSLFLCWLELTDKDKVALVMGRDYRDPHSLGVVTHLIQFDS